LRSRIRPLSPFLPPSLPPSLPYPQLLRRDHMKVLRREKVQVILIGKCIKPFIDDSMGIRARALKHIRRKRKVLPHGKLASSSLLLGLGGGGKTFLFMFVCMKRKGEIDRLSFVRPSLPPSPPSLRYLEFGHALFHHFLECQALVLVEAWGGREGAKEGEVENENGQAEKIGREGGREDTYLYN